MEEFRICLFLTQLGQIVVQEYVLCSYSFIPKLDDVDIPNMHYSDTFDQDYQFCLN